MLGMHLPPFVEINFYLLVENLLPKVLFTYPGFDNKVHPVFSGKTAVIALSFFLPTSENYWLF
jgi:hypothetical protein